jgi:hypothetical protein
MILLHIQGVCGDPFQGITDKALDGYWARTTLTPSATYSVDQRVRFTWQLTTNHGGYVAFKICNRNTGLDQACFDANPLSRSVSVIAW